MVTLFAALSALTYGAADFIGGLATRKSPVTAVVAWSQGVGLLVALVAAPLLGPSKVVFGDLAWGVVAGLSGALGVGLLYQGLATGLASVVSPAAAVTGAALPVLFGILRGEQPKVLAWIGVAVALPAILLLSMERGDGKGNALKSLRMGLLAGCGFGGFFIFIAQSGEASGMWPLVAARSFSVPFLFLVTALRGQSLVLAPGSRVSALTTGALDMGANIFYLLATRSGILVIAVVVTALYPAPTVLLQRVVLGERLGWNRIIGLALAIVGVALIGLG